MLTVGELMELFLDPDTQRVSIFDYIEKQTVFEGYYEEMPEKIKESPVTNIDNLYPGQGKTITINIW